MPWWTFSQTPSICRTRSKFFLPPFPCTMYTTPSMTAGFEHSAPLKVKYHRLQQSWQLLIRRTPLKKTPIPVFADVLLKTHSCENWEGKKNSEKTKLEFSKLYARYIVCLTNEVHWVRNSQESIKLPDWASRSTTQLTTSLDKRDLYSWHSCFQWRPFWQIPDDLPLSSHYPCHHSDS